jgi:hypothetical protein
MGVMRRAAAERAVAAIEDIPLRDDVFPVWRGWITIDHIRNTDSPARSRWRA